MQPETELNKQVCTLIKKIVIFFKRFDGKYFLQIIESEDSSSSSDTIQKPVNVNHHQHLSSNLIPKNLEALLKSISVDPNMTSLESMAAAQLAAFQRLPELNQLNSFYPSRCRVKLSEISQNVFKTIHFKFSFELTIHNVVQESYLFSLFSFRYVFSTISTTNITYDDTRPDSKPISQSTDKC